MRSPTLIACLTIVSLIGPSLALFPYKILHNDSHELALSPDEWVSEYQCDLAELSSSQNGTSEPPPLECFRDKNSWLYKHVDEVQDDFKLLVRQDSIDARFADIVYLTNGHTGMDFHHYKFNSGSAKQDALNRELAAGPEASSSLCRRHLHLTLSLLEDLAHRVNRMRAQSNNSNSSNSYTPEKLGEAHLRLARVLDSFGRYESGQLGGRYHSFGLYDQCITTALLLPSSKTTPAQDNKDELVGTRYCWARLNLERHLSRSLRGIARGSTSAPTTSFFPGDFAYHMAICLPKSCHSKTFDSNGDEDARENMRLVQRLIDSQLAMPNSMYIDHSLPLESVFCLVDERSQLAAMPWAGRLFLGFVLFWTLACVVVTYRRRAKHIPPDEALLLHAKDRKQSSIWSNLDLFDSWFDFLGEREQSHLGGYINLDPLNYVKCACTVLVVLAHAAILPGPLTLAHTRLHAFMETHRFESLTLFGFVLVDSFFVITGMMMSYIFLRRASSYERRMTAQADGAHALPLTVIDSSISKEKSSYSIGIRTPAMAINFEREFSPIGRTYHKACTLLALSRYIRLVPLFLLAFWFKKTVYPYLGTGPMWDYGLNRDTSIGGCLQESWLTPFTFASSYLPGAQQCLPQTWTISNDIFFSLVISPIVVLLYKWPRSAIALSVVNVTLSLYLGKRAYLQLDAQARFEIEKLRDHSIVILFQIASYIYALPLYRMPAILVGCLSGYILFKYSQFVSPSSKTTSDKEIVSSPADGRMEEAATGATENGAGTKREETPNDQWWPWWFRGPLTHVSAAIVVLAVVNSLLTPEFRKYATPTLKRYMVIYMLLYYHLTWSLANSVIFLRIVTDWNKHFILRFAASRFFNTVGKLSYAILLFHWDLIIYDLHSGTQGRVFSRWYYFGSMARSYLGAIPIAIFVFVVFENPLDKLTKAYIPRV